MSKIMRKHRKPRRNSKTRTREQIEPPGESTACQSWLKCCYLLAFSSSLLVSSSSVSVSVSPTSAAAASPASGCWCAVFALHFSLHSHCLFHLFNILLQLRISAHSVLYLAKLFHSIASDCIDLYGFRRASTNLPGQY